MKLKYLLICLCFMPGLADAATRGAGNARVGMARGNTAAASRMPTMAPGNLTSTDGTTKTSTGLTLTDNTVAAPKTSGDESTPVTSESTTGSGTCRDAYWDCMDQFCLMDESEGYRCVCSDNFNQSKDLINEILAIQTQADELYNEGVEREKLGAKARLVFGETNADAAATTISHRPDLRAWLKSDSDSLDADENIGDALYQMAAEYCENRLDACGDDADMVEMLYARQIVNNCKTFSSYLGDQKTNALAYKRTAEAAVRTARAANLDTTNKYNSGECLLAYRSCIADKGGCGSHFENCLDAKLLSRRADACENILDQCMATRDYVLTQWADEAEMILADAAKYADKNQRATCLARIQDCLEESCSTGTNTACLTDVNVAAGICPVITECNEMIPGIQSVINDKLAYLRSKFCENDVDKCLQDKCGQNYDGPECLGKSTSEIVALCPQSRFPSCKDEPQFDIIVSAALLQMDYQMLQGCLNYFGEQLNRVCGTDMSCLPANDTVMALKEIPDDAEDFAQLRVDVREQSKQAVDDFFKQFEKDITVSACADTVSAGKGKKNSKSLGQNVFNSAKMIAEISAENRAMRELETKIAEISRKLDVAAAEKLCKKTYKVENPKDLDEKKKKNYSYIRSVSFEPSLRNCHVCRMQQVCETGGMSKSAAGLKAAAGGMAAGASAGTMVAPGWGTAIGTVVGAVGGFFGGRSAGGKEEFCQEVESCEDINM